MNLYIPKDIRNHNNTHRLVSVKLSQLCIQKENILLSS